MTKRAVGFVLLGLGAIVLAGCPIYPDSRDNRVCVDGGDCYECPTPFLTRACSAWLCTGDQDCPSDEVCTNRRCVTGSQVGGSTAGACSKPADCTTGSSCGADNQCHTGDCSTSGCPTNYVCKLTGGAPVCTFRGGDAGSGGTTSTCKNDAACGAVSGAKCLTGSCVAPQDQCGGASQCPGDGQCVDGVCTPTCSATKSCPTGYACDTAKGVCTGTTGACGDAVACSGRTVCVEEHCVDPCGGGGTCPSGLTCVDGGCTPDEKPIYVCDADGQVDKCHAGSICLRHSCYIGCDGDAGACQSADAFNVCKTVTTSSGDHAVCGKSNGLGTECDPSLLKNCPSPGICIDGFCK